MKVRITKKKRIVVRLALSRKAPSGDHKKMKE
jgi:hypothetical protein